MNILRRQEAKDGVATAWCIVDISTGIATSCMAILVI